MVKCEDCQYKLPDKPLEDHQIDLFQRACKLHPKFKQLKIDMLSIITMTFCRKALINKLDSCESFKGRI